MTKSMISMLRSLTGLSEKYKRLEAKLWYVEYHYSRHTHHLLALLRLCRLSRNVHSPTTNRCCMHGHRATFSPSNCLYALTMQDIIDPSRTDAVSDKGVPVQHWVPALVNPRAPPVGLFVSEISGIPADTIQFVPATDSRSVRDNPTPPLYIIYQKGMKPIGKLV